MRGEPALLKAHGITPLGLDSTSRQPGVTSTPGYSGRTPPGFKATLDVGKGSRGRAGLYCPWNRLESELVTVRAKMQAYLEELGV